MSENSQTNLNDHYECYIYNELQKEEIGYYQTTEDYCHHNHYNDNEKSTPKGYKASTVRIIIAILVIVIIFLVLTFITLATLLSSSLTQ